MKFENLSDGALRLAVAEHVAGFKELRMSRRWEVTDPPEDPCVLVGIAPSGYSLAIPNYPSDANAVIPLLCKWRWYVNTSWCTGGPGDPFPPVPTHIWVKIFVSEQWLPPFPFPKEPTRGYNDPFVWAGNGPFAHTACVALLRAHGHEVID